MHFKKTLLAAAVMALTPAASYALEEVVVTGTRKVGQAPTETISPIDVISGDALKNQGTFDLTDSLTKIAPALNTQRFPIADGTAFVRPVTLRNLSPDHTLVLVDGARRHRSALVNLQLAPLGTVNQGSQAVDFATFPSAAIKRVEVLRDGASAQYGSDAIAGVVNVILNDANEGFNVSAQYGEYDEEDGERLIVSANGGFAITDNGFLNLTAEWAETDTTSRGNPTADAQAVGAFVDSSEIPYNGLGQRWGDPDIEAAKFFANAGFDVSDSLQLYGNASYMENETEGGFFYRTPVLPGDGNVGVPARSTLQTDNDGDGQPDVAPADLVASITGMGLNPADYLTADEDSPSGFVLRNPIASMFPGGYSPLFGADITDMAFVAGARGEISSTFTWNLRGRYGENEVDYNLVGSINPSIGGLSPTNFNPGTLTQEETGVNLDFVKTFDDSPLNVAFGAEWRRENYKIDRGDPASIEVGPVFAQFGVGSDGFQGFFEDTAGSWNSDAWAVYLDVEEEVTDQWTVGVAMRYESYDDFDDSTDWKLSTRYDFTDSLAVRATANTAFRAPSPGQVNTLNVTTSANSAGELIPSGTYPVDNPVARVLGSTDVGSEESLAYTLGLVWTPGERWSVTLDYYNIEIDDRIAVATSTIDERNVADLNAMGFPNADVLLGSSASYFTNGFDTEVSGIDLAVGSWWEMGEGIVSADLRYNYNEQKIRDVIDGAIGPDRVYDLENQVPEESAVFTLDYSSDALAGLVRVNYYGDWSTTDGIFGDGTADTTQTYGSEVLVDVELSYTFLENYTVAVGGENIFDEYPDKETGFVASEVFGVEYAITSPFGFNGAFWYARLAASF